MGQRAGERCKVFVTAGTSCILRCVPGSYGACRFALQNGTFQATKRPVLHRRARNFIARNEPYCREKPDCQQLADVHPFCPYLPTKLLFAAKTPATDKLSGAGAWQESTARLHTLTQTGCRKKQLNISPDALMPARGRLHPATPPLGLPAPRRLPESNLRRMESGDALPRPRCSRPTGTKNPGSTNCTATRLPGFCITIIMEFL